ncbi:uncharacterized protein LOC126680793 isoform X2 [Mercurialis annua]|uniref:uncharacterized protein LOC126680793 isoform X2 n=1 Tax=Mercurialis annua TaxID=3986 RepID=UPI00215ED447|nr:uncharacterized protein LOC126680793 isoform X2 [Mercurialis annua]
MEGKQTKRKKETENTKEDRLSELPDCLLHHIFSFADATDAVRSCTLSKRWRFPNLETLTLEDTQLRGIRKFSVCSLNLKSFDFLNNGNLMRYPNCEFVIVAPKLTKFKFHGYHPLDCSTENLSSLDHIEFNVLSNKELDNIYHTDELKQKFARKVLQMLNALHTAKSITLSNKVIQVLSYFPASLNEHPSQFLNLKYMKAKSIRKSSKKIKIPRLILNYFLKSSPLLEIS